jgi:hypothetical protein
MNAKHGDQAETHDPQNEPARGETSTERPQSLCVFGDSSWAFVYVKIADHVRENEPQQADPSEGHQPFLADCRLAKTQRKR